MIFSSYLIIKWNQYDVIFMLILSSCKSRLIYISYQFGISDIFQWNCIQNSYYLCNLMKQNWMLRKISFPGRLLVNFFPLIPKFFWWRTNKKEALQSIINFWQFFYYFLIFQVQSLKIIYSKLSWKFLEWTKSKLINDIVIK